MLLICGVRFLLGDIRLTAPELLVGLHLPDALLLLPQPRDLLGHLQVLVFLILELASPVLVLVLLSLGVRTAQQHETRTLDYTAALPQVEKAVAHGDRAQGQADNLIGGELVVVPVEVVAQAGITQAHEQTVEGARGRGHLSVEVVGMLLLADLGALGEHAGSLLVARHCVG